MGEIKCPKCGSSNLRKAGFSYSVGSLKRSQYRCCECGELFYYPYIPKREE